MSLLDDLRAIEHFPPSHLPSASELLEIVGKLIGYAEHGDELLKAAEQDAKARESGDPATAIDNLLSPPEEEPPPAPSSPAPTGSSVGSVDVSFSGETNEQRIARLEQELATAKAQEQRTQASVAPIIETDPAAPAEPAPGDGGHA